MSEEQAGIEPGSAEPVAPAPETGHGAVDGVIASLAGLAELPVDEHVAVFEHAHEQLRGALDAPSGPRPPTSAGPVG